MTREYVLILATILYASWKFGQAWIRKNERRKRDEAW